MNLDYKTTTKPGSLRTIHIIVIEAESLTTTIAKEVLIFAKARNPTKYEWQEIKEAVRLGRPLTIRGGKG